ncbi:MAG: hypothetical protein MUO53_00635 [Maribacter sp.]|nr:hypothetical protein [Maribacter sp.]
MRYLLISSALLFLSCGSYPKRIRLSESARLKSEISNPYFSETTLDYVYKADITFYGRHFSGLFIVKKMAENHHRLVFTTEMGNTLFDFSFNGRDFIVNSINEKLDKKMVIALLRNDFLIMISEHPPKMKTFTLGNQNIFESEIDHRTLYYFYSEVQLKKIVRTKGRKEKVVFNFSEIVDGNAKIIQILHKNIQLIIQLKAI